MMNELRLTAVQEYEPKLRNQSFLVRRCLKDNLYHRHILEGKPVEWVGRQQQTQEQDPGSGVTNDAPSDGLSSHSLLLQTQSHVCFVNVKGQ